MKQSFLFVLIVLTAFTAFLFTTGIPELCAVGVFLALYCLMGWANLIEEISN